MRTLRSLCVVYLLLFTAGAVKSDDASPVRIHNLTSPMNAAFKLICAHYFTNYYLRRNEVGLFTCPAGEPMYLDIGNLRITHRHRLVRGASYVIIYASDGVQDIIPGQ
jgi:hypothetical protein